MCAAMRKQILLSFVWMFATGLFAQKHVELGILTGVANYSGDISEPDIEIRQSRPAFGVFARLHLSEAFILKGQFYMGRIFGDDRYSDTRAPRNFKFSSPLHELSAVVEYAPLHFGFENSQGNAFYFFPYLFVGAGGVYVRPKVEYYGPEDGRPVYIKTPFPEEGKAQRVLLCTPVGAGLRFHVKQKIVLGIEGGWRPVYSDLLDGISTNGNPDANDWYYFGGISVSYFLNGLWKMKED